MYKRLSIIFCILIISCDSNLLPEDYVLTQKDNYYLGLYEVTVFDIRTKSIKQNIKGLKGYPKPWVSFNDKYFVKDWDFLNTKAKYFDVFKKLVLHEENRASIDLDKSLKHLVLDMKSNPKEFLISGYYKQIGQEKNFYSFYIIDVLKNQLTSFEKGQDL